jgi:hypothetical protein
MCDKRYIVKQKFDSLVSVASQLQSKVSNFNMSFTQHEGFNPELKSRRICFITS